MSTLSQMYFHISISLTDSDKQLFKEYVEDRIKRCAFVLYCQEVDLRIEVIDGSVKCWISIAGALYLAIGQYGSFRAGIDQLIKDSKTLQAIVMNDLNKNGMPSDAVIEKKRLSATPDKIRRLLLRIDRLEQNSEKLTTSEKKTEIQGILAAVEKILYEMEVQEDREMLMSEIAAPYRPTKPLELPQQLRLNILHRRRDDELLPFLQQGSLMLIPTNGDSR